jgi:hypothetical protein
MEPNPAARALFAISPAVADTCAAARICTTTRATMHPAHLTISGGRARSGVDDARLVGVSPRTHGVRDRPDRDCVAMSVKFAADKTHPVARRMHHFGNVRPWRSSDADNARCGDFVIAARAG